MQLRWLVCSLAAISSPASARNLIGMISTERAELPPDPVPAPAAVAPARSLPILVVGGLDSRVLTSGGSVDVREVGDTAIVRLTFEVASTREFPRAVRLNIGLPHDARVVGMSSTLGGEVYHGVSELAVNAREQFDKLLVETVDPALLEWTRRTPDAERLTLSLFPVSKTQHATTQLTITMPRFRRLLVDIDHVRIERQGGAPAEAPRDEDLALASSPGMVTEGASLYASPPTPAGPSRSEIARYLRANDAALRACYPGPGAEPAAAGDDRLRFQIGTDGRVDAGSISGSTSELTACAAPVLAAWQFHPSERPVQVSYPVASAPRVASRTAP
jgi:hypothetical protein